MRMNWRITAWGLVLTTGVWITATALGGSQGRGRVRGQGPGAGHGGMAMRERGMTDPEHAKVRELLSGHRAIVRTVEQVPKGVRTVTTTSDPKQVATLRAHVRQMARRVVSGRPVRMWDPVFRDIFANAAKVRMVVRDVEGGVEVVETSDDPSVVPMIRAHAAKVDRFVAEGHEAARPPWAGGGRGPHR